MADMNTPDLLRCPITMELFRDPVLTPDGNTYEKQAIEQWVRNHGTNPMTRQPLSIEQLCPNRIIKQLVDGFETLLQQKNYQFILDVDVRRRKGRPLFMTVGKTIYGAEWIPPNNNRPEIVLLKIDGARARKEASFYVNLSRHPNIIRTFGFVCDRNNSDQNNSILLLQEYAPEGSLYELLQDRRTALDEKVLTGIFLQIIEAMICLAYNNVIHGDLACRNVLVFRFDENQPERNIVKITDFGLSRHSQLYLKISSPAQTTLNIIPIRYAAPEILSSNAISENYTEKSDVYSMGVLMWEAYSRGSMPWMNIEDDNEVIRRVRNGDLLPQPSNCSQPFWSIIKKAWSRSPSDRPTFMEFKQLLAAQFYRSGTILHNSTERYDTSIKYNLTESDRKLAQRHQEEENRKFAEQQQRQYNRKLGQQQQGEGYREYIQQQQATYNRQIFQQQQQEQDRKIAQKVALDEKRKEEQRSKLDKRPDIFTTQYKDVLHLETPEKYILTFEEIQDEAPDKYDQPHSFSGIPDPTSKFPEVAALRDTNDRDYICGNRASRNRYAKAYTAIAYAHPNILPLPMFCGDGDPPYEVPHPRFW